MDGILVYQKGGRAMSGEEDFPRRMVFVSEPEEAAYELEKGRYRMVMIHLDGDGDGGLEVAYLVRGLPGYCLTPIVFLAVDRRHEERAFREIHCYDYLVKPIQKEEVIRILYPFLVQFLAEGTGKCMKVRVHGETRMIPLDEIVYLESHNRSVRIHAKWEVLAVPYLSLQQCLAEYGDVFVQCHRCVLVNRNCVQGINFRKGTIKLPGCQVDIGRRYEMQLHREFDSEWRGPA